MEKLLAGGATYYDVDKIQNEKASKYFGRQKVKGLTVGQFFDRRNSDAVTHVGTGKPGIYVRGGESALDSDFQLKLHEVTHLAAGGRGNLDVSLARRLGIKVNKGQTASNAVSNYFNSNCK